MAVLWGGLQHEDLVVVDSAPLIYPLDGHPAFAPLIEGLFDAYESGVVRIALSTIAVTEVLAGPFKHAKSAGQTLRGGAS
nr:hypothetical protein [Variovorax boronicumulans]